MVGPARHKRCHYKCTVYYERVERSDWPVPYTHTDQTQERGPWRDAHFLQSLDGRGVLQRAQAAQHFAN